MKALFVIPAVILCGALGLLAASCGSSEATSAGPVPSVSEAETGSTSAPAETETAQAEATLEEGSEAGGSGPVTYEVWFANDEGLFVTYRTADATPRVGTAALLSLLEGPNDFERGYGLTTAVPEGTQLLGLSIEDGVAHVDLTSEFESGGGTRSLQTRLAQVVYTLTQFPTVKRVLFSLDGEPVEVIRGEGVVVDRPVGRNDFTDVLPAILVEGPALGETVTNPVEIFGSANVFEANVSVEILDADGKEIARTFVTATCGSGCRGTFVLSVPYDVNEEQDGTIVVHDDDAAGAGRPPHEVRIPVTLTPA